MKLRNNAGDINLAVLFHALFAVLLYIVIRQLKIAMNQP